MRCHSYAAAAVPCALESDSKGEVQNCPDMWVNLPAAAPMISGTPFVFPVLKGQTQVNNLSEEKKPSWWLDPRLDVQWSTASSLHHFLILLPILSNRLRARSQVCKWLSFVSLKGLSVCFLGRNKTKACWWNKLHTHTYASSFQNTAHIRRCCTVLFVTRVTEVHPHP